MTLDRVNSQSEPLTISSRLKRIDELRAKNIGTYLPLPQLVAVGDQSSGKSSLLETLTGIPFPRSQELCTRYATQITHRREEQSSITISIIPGPQASPDDKQKLVGYSRELETTAQLRTEFATILQQVNTLMNIKSVENPSGEKTFSEDVLRIEKRGPNEDYLTIIDVPGIFRITTEGITTKNDVNLVKNMVKKYISDERTIILAVLPSTVDVATQEIIEFAEEVDATGERTLGILTKPDLVHEHSAKLAICNLVKGCRRPLNLGYYVVRNRGGDDEDEDSITTNALVQREAIFQQPPWNTLPEDRVGVTALRTRLGELLGQITDRAFPQLRAETRQMLEITQKELLKLGPSRSSEREQRMYLMGIASEFQRLVRAALDANYSAHPAFARKELRLITMVVNITEKFNHDFSRFAQTYYFESEEASEDASGTEDNEAENSHANGLGLDDGLEDEINIPRPDMYPDIDSIVVSNWMIGTPHTGILDWIESVYRRSRGLEIGTFSQNIPASVFREQSEKWGMITKQYLSKIILIIHRYILNTLEVVCPDVRVRQEVTYSLSNDLLLQYELGMKHSTFLVDVERQLKPYTLNHYFNQNYQRKYGRRVRDTLRPKAREDGRKAWSTLVVELNNIADAISNKSNTAHVKETIHDILEAYYRVAQKRFMDNVFSQAVDYTLLSGPSSPLSLFSEQWVLKLDGDRLQTIAGESLQMTEKRRRLQAKIEDLEGAMRILR